MKIIALIGAALLLLIILRAFSTRGGGGTLGDHAGPVATPPTDDSIRELVIQGRKIQAIKAYRMLHRVDLKEAKEAVERMEEQLPPTS